MKKQTSRSRNKAPDIERFEVEYAALIKAAELIENEGGQTDNYYRNRAVELAALIKQMKSKSGQLEEGQQEN
jgi:hypothetical protein